MNVTRLCNQACRHCHVDASPKRRETMSRENIDACLRALERHAGFHTLDITGGAPELHPDFRFFVRGGRRLGKKVIARHNLTVTFDPHPVTGESMSSLPDFFAEEKVEVVSSLPYYQEFFTDKQRGRGAFQKSIDGIRMLNERGYARSPDLILNLVYNPVGPYLPGDQEALERKYKEELETKFGVFFDRLFTITNMPINRFRTQLLQLGQYEAYMEKLLSAFRPDAARGVMCRGMVSVSHDGSLYDCDFNQMLNLPAVCGIPMTIESFDPEAFLRRSIVFDSHCFGCTAGAGSSCGGATAAGPPDGSPES